jgi:hypothetical protein
MEIIMNYHKTFEVGKKDNERFNLFSMKRKTIRMSVMVFLMISFMVTLTQLTRDNQMIYALLAGIGYGIAGILFFVIMNLLLVKYRLYLFYKRGSIKPFRQQIEMNEKGIRAKTENGSVEVTFDQIGGVRETKHAFYILVTAEHVYVFPKNQMIGEEEFCEIRNIFKAGISADRLQLQT